MIPATFDYEVAGSAEEAVRLLGESDDAKLLAGGHSLLPLMRLRFARPSLLVDIGRLSDLAYVRDAGDRVAIGALTRHHDVATSELLARACPLLARTAGQVGDPQVRHRGTIGGSVAHGDPASDVPAALLALGAELVAIGPGGERTIPAAEFFRGYLETALAPRELLTEIRVPRQEGGSAYVKLNRRAQDWATVAVAVAAGSGGTRVALVNMGPTPLRATAVEAALAGGASIEEAAARAAEGTNPPSDTNGSSDYRRHLATVLTRRALEQALAA
ncbi:MAG: xanthine dehydrogenase family protein subunit M [Thermoleophilia bacterium]|nr:xanthine dehydrogenase family protein subunit M [Thermoleophilia bacterium]